jgi:hypothetical protein
MDWPTIVTSAAAAAVISTVGAVIGSTLTFRTAERRLRREFRLEFAAEDAARTLLDYDKHLSRTFGFLRHRLRGFKDDDELRRILVRCGAVHILGTRGEERWGLRERNPGYRDRTLDEKGMDFSGHG